MTEQTPEQHIPGTGARLEGKTAIVTGASRGIGLAIARRLAAEGARVCITARNIGPLKEAAAEFPEGSVLVVAGKSDDPDHRAEVLETVTRAWGQLDILVNNAGVNPVYGPLTELDPAAGRRILDVNLLGTLGWVQDVCAYAALDFTGRGGAILNLSSVSAQTPAHGIGFYGISKAAVEQLTRTLAVELAPSVRVNALAPAVVKTQFARALYEGREEKVSASYPLKRLGTPEDIAGAAAFLVSEDAAWITGQILNLDGGLLAAGGSA
ncbi:SDR family oxidoreductase [Arthrobacter zhangbolii]|uniref:SDR family oxidoreductase n=1 Tax=Arthrobacter zhangbolii TaxID=2886936 RepID=A0A9X1M8N9_9MICC|nr:MULTISPECIES: SDR family oxidoreductase [Arthrobacter]MCC3272389.1 SDR family oxidoreductase [Arthrobacter zhangbolii]MCC3294129.1 SDR family oxidoreductase [Arthrobacter zhangbolii]MDN3903454.1 SDR family oxidoreductase [Arthrobacter sp. YD2]UON91749.1 SDR family oxidoreductase [Arthrobacter zhangbolii]